MDDTKTAEILNHQYSHVPRKVFRGTAEEELLAVEVGRDVVKKKLKELKPAVLQQLARVPCKPLSKLIICKIFMYEINPRRLEECSVMVEMLGNAIASKNASELAIL